MRRLVLLSWVLVVAGCRKPAPVEIAVADAAARFAANEATPVDANTPEYREGAGWIPNAVLLTDFHEYPLAELPADKDRPLVFYCTSRM
ncbi:MAG: rhodanese-like domain-containing protein [Myxococcaceae bacterium]|nr:rhodanese-like domain-containing protein [Myxococcaceae bacterium]